MSAINVVTRPDRVFFMTDASIYRQDGRLAGIGEKVVTMPALKAALATRGSFLFNATLVPIFGQHSSFDEIIETGADTIKAHYESMVGTVRANGGQASLEVYLSAFSESRDRFETYVLNTFATDHADAFEWFSADDVIFAPSFESLEAMVAAHLVLQSENLLDFDAATFDPRRHARGLFEMQRQEKIRPLGVANSEPQHIVGGHVTLTELSRNGVSQSVIHRWSDQIGEFITPSSPTAAQLAALKTSVNSKVA